MKHKSEVNRQIMADKIREQLRQHVKVHLALGDMAIELIKTNFTIGLKDLPGLTEIKVRKDVLIKSIERDASQLRKLMSSIIGVDPEYEELMEGEHAYEVYRLVRNLGFMSTDQLREFNDLTEKQNEQARKTAANV